MLPGLRHRSLVGGDDQQQEVDPGGAGQHVLDEVLVAGDIDHRYLQLRIVGGKASEAEVDRDPPLAFLLPPVGVDTGESFDKRRLAVIDVAGGSEDDRSHPSRCSRKRNELSGR